MNLFRRKSKRVRFNQSGARRYSTPLLWKGTDEEYAQIASSNSCDPLQDVEDATKAEKLRELRLARQTIREVPPQPIDSEDDAEQRVDWGVRWSDNCGIELSNVGRDDDDDTSESDHAAYYDYEPDEESFAPNTLIKKKSKLDRFRFFHYDAPLRSYEHVPVDEHGRRNKKSVCAAELMSMSPKWKAKWEGQLQKGKKTTRH